MVKLCIFLVFLCLAVMTVMSAPMEEDEGRADRQRRVTCDLLSVAGMVGDSACAANCLSMGKAGGSCSGGVCQCRTTKIKDLWDKRFG
ncbi:defensin-like [Leptopilina heterotoma]|uniref:defensin-like n=1 Tax=Leptopilina heterotoma TaxID=63436 RepID=UPI001CA96E7A|nr:defensin-like [Leptopilina heterotoma]